MLYLIDLRGYTSIDRVRMVRSNMPGQFSGQLSGQIDVGSIVRSIVGPNFDPTFPRKYLIRSKDPHPSEKV